jgi:hypothetical protein
MYSQDHLMRPRQDDLPWAAASMRAGTKRTPRQHSSHPLGLRLWTLLHAQSLLNGPASGAPAIASIEDDYRRFRTPGRR